VNSFQSGNVIGTIIEIENFDLHSLSNLPLVPAERAFSQAGDGSNAENNKQKYAWTHRRQIQCGKRDVYCREQIDRTRYVAMPSSASCGVANTRRGMTSNAGIHSIGRAFCQFKPTMRATTGRHHNRSALQPRAKSLVSQLCSDMRTSTASGSNSPCAIHFNFTAVRARIGHLPEGRAVFRAFPPNWWPPRSRTLRWSWLQGRVSAARPHWFAIWLRVIAKIHCTFIVRKCFWLRSRGAGRCPRIAPVRKAARGVEISLARVIVIDLRAENSRTRCAAFGVGVNSEVGCSQAAGVSTNSLAMANDLSMKSCE
jgi:hypothetical protein